MSKDHVIGNSEAAIEVAFSKVSDTPVCGSVAQQIEDGALAGQPLLVRALELIAEENARRGMPEDMSNSVLLGARVMALLIAEAETGKPS